MGFSHIDPPLARALRYQFLMLSSSLTPLSPAMPADPPVITTRAELAECNCPEECERDHEFD
jgi:hypothetical protein